MAKLVITRDGATEGEAPLTGGLLRIGRDPENQVVLNDPDKGVSRFHAEVRQEGDTFTVVDLGSRNGIWVDGQRVPSAVLRPGTSVTIGSHELTFADEPLQPPDEFAPTIMVPGRHPGAVRDSSELTPLALPRSQVVPIAPKTQVRMSVGGLVPLMRDRFSAWTEQPVYFWSVVACALLVVGAVVVALVYRPGGGSAVARVEQSVTPPTPPPVPDPKEEIARVIDAAKARVANKDYDGALADLQSALDRFPGDAGLQAAKAEAEAARDAEAERNRAVAVDQSRPDFPGIPQRPGESPEAYVRRARRVQDKFNSGKKSQQQKDFRSAIEAFGSIELEHQDAKRFLTQAKQDLSNARRDAMSKGADAERNSAWEAALESYRQADGLDSGADTKDAVQRMQVKVENAKAQAAAAARGAAPKTEPIVVAHVSPTTAGDKRTPTDTADALMSYPRAKLLVLEGTKGKDKDVNLHFGAGQIAVLPKDGGAPIASVKYKDLAHATYAHAKEPKWNPSAPMPPDKLETPGGLFGSKGARNWLVLQSKTVCLILSLDNSNADEIVTQLEARTGLKVDRPAGGL